MVRKTGLTCLMVLFLLIACAVVPMAGKLYHGTITNNTGLIVDLAILDMESEELIKSHMFSHMEVWSVSLPAGHYHVIASCSKGYLEKCLVFPDMLRHPDKPWSVFLWAGNRGGEA